MPYKIRKSGGKFQVVGPFKDEKTHVYGTHDTEGEACAQQKALYVHTEALNNGTPSPVRNSGENPTPATDMSGGDKRPSKNIETDKVDTDPAELLPTHIDNRELQLGVNIITKENPELKANLKKAVIAALGNLVKDPQYYSNLISQGKVNNPEVVALYTKLFKRDTSLMVPHETELVGMREEIKKIIKLALRKKLNESSRVDGSNGLEPPHASFILAGQPRGLGDYTWFKEGSWIQVDFPISDDPFGNGSGFRKVDIVQQTPAMPTFNSAESDDFVTASDMRSEPNVQVLNKVDVKDDNKAAKDLVKATKPKLIKLNKLPKLENKMKSLDVKKMIREELKSYLTETKSPLNEQLQSVVDGKVSYIQGENIKPGTAIKMLAIYKMLSLKEQKMFNNGTIKQAIQLLKNVEAIIKQSK